MFAVQSWNDFFENKNTNKAVIAYGAGACGYFYLAIGGEPLYFCDRYSSQINYVTHPLHSEKKYKVLSLTELTNLEQALHIIVTILFANENQYKAAIGNIREALKEYSYDVTVYVHPEQENEILMMNGHIIKDGAAYLCGKWVILNQNMNFLSRLDDIRPAYSGITDYSVEYLDSIISIPMDVTVWGGKMMLTEMHSKYVNHINGKRHTAFQPDCYDNHIYCVGDSCTYGSFVEDADTFCSNLQKSLQGRNLHYKVENMGLASNQLPRTTRQLMCTDLRPGDIVLVSACHYRQLPNTGTLEERVEASAQSLREAKSICDRYNCLFFVLNIPLLYSKKNKSKFEDLFISQYVNSLHKGGFSVDYKVVDAYTTALLARLAAYKINYIDLTDVFDNCDFTLYVDICHFGPIGHQLIANRILESILSVRSMPDDTNRDLAVIANEDESVRKAATLILQNEKEIHDRFIKEMSEKNECEHYVKQIVSEYKINVGNAGAIVMNCNPFTKGHMYLIEKALSMVDYLYVFILEENQSEISFEERIRLTRLNTETLGRVSIIPGGKYIISSTTFPEYFIKDLLQDNTIDMSEDLMTFAAYIAPAMGITIRFVGEEPICKVTRQYNEQMKRILPKYGIEVKEIPRFCLRNDVISASKVRALLKSQDYELLNEYVPDITLEFLFEKYIRENLL